MALELPAQVDVDLQRSRLSSVKLTKREELALQSVKDKELRGLLAQLVRALGGSQQNFERVALQFPLSPGEGGVVLGPEVVGFPQLKIPLKELVEDLELRLDTFPPEGLNATRGVTAINIGSQGGYHTGVEHGLGATPTVVIANMADGGFQTNVTTDEYTGTTFRIGAYRTDGPNVGSRNVAWIAMT